MILCLKQHILCERGVRRRIYVGGQAREYLSRGIRVMINSPPAANSKPFITVNTGIYVCEHTRVHEQVWTAAQTDTHTHTDDADILD